MGVDEAETQTMTPKPGKRPLPVLERGTCVGRYVILDRLGVGGMGVVYRAYDPDLDRRIALKLVRAISADATARMVREAQALAKVSHPNIVQIFDVGVFGETVFIAMELVEGRTLSKWNRETQPAWRPLLALLIEAGRGLAAVHAAGLVHRDFKPQNVIVGADGRVRVLDFGVARSANTELDTPALDDDGGDLPRVMVSQVTGTPVYMAPEQQRRGVLDARADQFAFAVTCWELLHGERPFVGDNLREYLNATATGKFRPPPAGNPTPAWVRRVLMRGMAAAPQDRHRSMDAALEALEADPARRRRKAIAIGLGATGALAIAYLIATRGSVPAPCEDAARHFDGVWDPLVATRLAHAFEATGASFAAETTATVRAELDKRAVAWTSMHREACRATRVSGEQSQALLDLRMGCLDRRRDELHALVEQLVAAKDGARVASAVEAVAQLPSTSGCADREALAAVVPLPDDPAQRSAIALERTAMATTNALFLTGQWVEARAQAEQLQTRAGKLGWAPLVAEADLLRGQVERHVGNFAASEIALTAAVQAAARAHLDVVSTAAWGELAWVVGSEEERPLEGLVLAAAAEAMAIRADAPQQALAEIAHTRSQIWTNKGDQAAALREAQMALALLDKSPEGAIVRVEVLNTIAMVRTAQGDYTEAEKVDRDVLERRRAALGAGHPKVADALDNLGVVRFHQGAYADARHDYEEALAMRVAALGPDSRDVGTSHNNLGGLLMETGDERGAAEHLEAALRIYEKTLGPTHADLAIPLSNLGDLATRRGDFDRAITYCARALALDERGGPDDPKLAFDLVCVAEAQLGRAHPEIARPLLARALALREHSEGDAGELARTRFDLARALWRGRGDRTRALALATTARDGFAAAGTAWQARETATIAWLRKPN